MPYFTTVAESLCGPLSMKIVLLCNRRIHRVFRTKSNPRALQGKPQRSSTLELLFWMLVGRIQECFADSDQVGLHAFHLFKRDSAENMFEVVEFGRGDADREL